MFKKSILFLIALPFCIASFARNPPTFHIKEGSITNLYNAFGKNTALVKVF